MLGTVERTFDKYIVYRDGGYKVYDWKQRKFVTEFPRSVNAYQNIGQLKIYLLASCRMTLDQLG